MNRESELIHAFLLGDDHIKHPFNVSLFLEDINCQHCRIMKGLNFSIPKKKSLDHSKHIALEKGFPMNLVTPSLEITLNEGFSQDLFNRENFGNQLMKLVERSNGKLVMSLDAQWGEGKSTFVRMWQGLLKKNKIHSIYIDAFENDYIDDAYISIISEITAYAEVHVPKSKTEQINNLKTKAKEIGVKLLPWSTRLLVKTASLGIIKDSDIEELISIKTDISKSTSTIVGNFIEEQLNSHKEDTQELSSFKLLLEELPNLITNNSNKPLVIIIDELDRCKPTYAVQIIEKIKHLFSVKNIVFLLVMHKSQLEEAVRNIYGQNIDAQTYLQKFINIETTLPKRVTARNENDLKLYCTKLYDLHQINAWNDKALILKFIAELAEHFDLSLRQLEKSFTNITIFYAISEEAEIRIPQLICFLSVIKTKFPSLFKSLLTNTSSYHQMCDFTNFPDFKIQHEKDSPLFLIITILKYTLLTDEQVTLLHPKDYSKEYFARNTWMQHFSDRK